MTGKISVNSQARLAEAITRLNTMSGTSSALWSLSVRARSAPLWLALYQRVAEMTQIGDTEDARRYCKLHFGVQILLYEDADFREGWCHTLRHLSYGQKLDLMGGCALFSPDGFPVTRLFNRARGSQYTDRIAVDFTARGVVFTELLGEVAA